MKVENMYKSIIQVLNKNGLKNCIIGQNIISIFIFLFASLISVHSVDIELTIVNFPTIFKIGIVKILLKNKT